MFHGFEHESEVDGPVCDFEVGQWAVSAQLSGFDSSSSESEASLTSVEIASVASPSQFEGTRFGT